MSDVLHTVRPAARVVVRAALFRAYQKLDQFQETTRFWTWLIRIALNESLVTMNRRHAARDVSRNNERIF